MKRIGAVVFVVFVLSACHKHSDDVASSPPGATNPAPVPVNPCDRGGTVTVNVPFGISSGHTMSIAVSGFMPDCGDSAKAYLSAVGQNNWYELKPAPTNEPSWYTIGLGSVTVHNGAAVQQDGYVLATKT